MAHVVSGHALRRLAQRGIPDEAIRLAISDGQRIHQNGATIFFLGERQLPRGLAPSVAAHLKNTAVVVTREGTILTAFKTNRLRRGLRGRRRRDSRRVG
jgi:hypothetical protein